VAGVSATELGYLSTVTSDVQTQLNGKASTTLDNLGTTAINADLLFAPPASQRQILVNASATDVAGKGIVLKSGDAGASGSTPDLAAGQISITSGNATGSGTGLVRFSLPKPGVSGTTATSNVQAVDIKVDNVNSVIKLYDTVGSTNSNSVNLYPSSTTSSYNFIFPASQGVVGDSMVLAATDGTLTYAPGSGYMRVVSKTFSDNNFTAGFGDTVILWDTSGGNSILNLVPAASYIRKVFVIKKTDSSANTLTIDPNGSELIEGASTKVLSVANESITVISDGSNWFMVNDGSGNLNEVTSAAAGERIERATITNNGSACAVASQSGSWVTSPTRNGAGRCSWTIPGGTFSATPQCTCTGQATTPTMCGKDNGVALTSTNYGVITGNNAGTATDLTIDVICMGPR
jgi:hypothetical protein